MNEQAKTKTQKGCLKIALCSAVIAVIFMIVLAANAADHATRVITLLSSGARSAATAQSSTYDVSAYIEGVILVNVTAESGTSGLSVTIQTSDDNETWYDHTYMDQITDTGRYMQAVSNLGKYIRVQYTVTGTSYTFEIAGVFKK